MEVFTEMEVWINDFLMNLGIMAPIISSLFIILEGVLAFLPLFVFITMNFLVLGPIFGGIISWICTIIGCMLTFYIFRLNLSAWFDKKIENKEKMMKFMNIVNNLKFTQLVLIIAIPFTPSFFVNLGAGLSHISKKKYLYALMLGKIFIVYFWGFVGSSLVECLTNPLALIKVLLMVGVAYILSVIINKKFNLDERF